MDKTDDFQLGQMYKIEPEEAEVKEDIDHWLDEEDIGNNGPYTSGFDFDDFDMER